MFKFRIKVSIFVDSFLYIPLVCVFLKFYLDFIMPALKLNSLPPGLTTLLTKNKRKRIAHALFPQIGTCDKCDLISFSIPIICFYFYILFSVLQACFLIMEAKIRLY